MIVSGAPSLSTEAFFIPDCRFLATSGFDPSIRMRDLSIGQAIRALINHTGSAGTTPFRANGRRLVTAANDGLVWKTTSDSSGDWR